MFNSLRASLQVPRGAESTTIEILQLMHDLKHELMIMEVWADIADSSAYAGARRLSELKESVDRAVMLMNELLPDDHVDANEVVRRMAATLSHAPPDAIRVHLDLCPDRLEVIAEFGDLSRLLLNLALNAFDAMPDGGVLTIATAIAHEGGLREAGASGRCARLTVSDTGCGMTAEVKDRIFDPFYSTKKGGTGLGLHSVAFTVERLHGRISVDSEPGRGTSVTVLIPLTRRSPF
jgi:two-component system, cell cycle sensor histidine kinase and response regulator CckA